MLEFCAAIKGAHSRGTILFTDGMLKSRARKSVKAVHDRKNAQKTMTRPCCMSYILDLRELPSGAITVQEGRRDVERKRDGDDGCEGREESTSRILQR